MSDASVIDAVRLQQAMARMQLMYAKPEHPYYILAPDYRETSSGIASLHYLCHLLNQNGREAYICGATGVNPDLRTPLLDDQIVARHRAAGKVPIAVYPEVASGNPLHCEVIARYLLNFEGFLNGKGMYAGPEDFLFYYGKLVAATEGAPGGDLLSLPIIDLSLFRTPPEGSPREGCYLYQNRFPLDQVNYAQLPADIRLLSMANALSLSELASLLRSAQVLYSHEWSMTCVMALLCGCPVIFIPGHGVDQQFLDNGFVGNSGFAMLDDPDAVAKATAGVAGALERYVAFVMPFWRELDVFIEKTQAAARHKAEQARQGATLWLEGRTPGAHRQPLIAARLATGPAPRLGIVVRHADGDGQRLQLTLDSLQAESQLYRNVQVLAGPGDAAALNAAVRDLDVDWFMCVEAGVEFTPAGLQALALALLELPAEQVALYADEALRMADGTLGIALRTHFNLDLLISFPAGSSRHWLLHRERFLALGGFASDCGSAFELEYPLRLVETQGLGCIGHVSEPLLRCDPPALRDCPDEIAVIQRHLQARGYTQASVVSTLPGRYRVDYAHAQQPGVSILIVLQGPLEQLQRCLDSVLENTDYAGYEVLLLDGGHLDQATQAWLDAVEQLGGEQLRVLRFGTAQSLAALRNEAARLARGDFLLWLDAAIASVSPGWLQQLLNHAQRPEVGAVGAKLLTPEGRIHHAGLLLGLDGPVGRAFQAHDGQDAGYLQRLQLDQGYTALSGECLLLARELFLQAGGFDEDPQLAPWVDVDLCLKLHQAGYLNVWTAHVQMVMQASLPAAISVEQEDGFYARWLPLLARDPAYNANLSLHKPGGFALADNALVYRPLQAWRPLPTVLGHQAGHDDSRHYRLIEPLTALKDAGLIESVLSASMLQVCELERLAPDSIVLQSLLGEPQLQAMRRMQAFSQAFKVLELSDYLPELPRSSPLRQQLPDDVFGNLQRGLAHVDRLLVPTPALAEVLSGLHADIRVVESRLSGARWQGLQAQRRVGKKPRVGWVGGPEQAADLEVIAEVVKTLATEVEWVFMGYCPASLRPYVHEFRVDVAHWKYPVALASLNLDLVLAPLEQNLFNACKGNQRLLEFGACGFPVIASNVRCFQGFADLPVTLVENRDADWLEAIRMHLQQLDGAAQLGDALRAAVLHGWMLDEQALQPWRKAWLPD